MLDTGKAHAKSTKINYPMLQEVYGRLTKKYGRGTFLPIDAIRVVDNIREGNLKRGEGGIVPYAMMIIDKNGNHILLIDVDAFDDENMLYVDVQHEVQECIMKIVPYANEAVRELATNFITLRDILDETEIGPVDESRLAGLGPDMEFLRSLQSLRQIKTDKGKVTDEEVIAAAVLVMKALPYYEELLKNVPEEFNQVLRAIDAKQLEMKAELERLEQRVNEEVLKYKAALAVFNTISEAKDALVRKVLETKTAITKTRGTLTAVADVKVPGTIANAAKKLKMVASIWRNNTDFVDDLVKSGEILELDVEKLRGEENAGLLGWIKEVSRGKASPFMFYSSRKSDIDTFLRDNQLQQAILTSGAVVTRFIDILDLENMDARADNRRYAALPYSRSGIYLAARVAAVKGEVGQLDNLTKTTLERIYTTLKADFSEADWNTIFTAPWSVLPPVNSMMDLLNNLRGAMTAIDAAA